MGVLTEFWGLASDCWRRSRRRIDEEGVLCVSGVMLLARIFPSNRFFYCRVVVGLVHVKLDL